MAAAEEDVYGDAGSGCGECGGVAVLTFLVRFFSRFLFVVLRVVELAGCIVWEGVYVPGLLRSVFYLRWFFVDVGGTHCGALAL